MMRRPEWLEKADGEEFLMRFLIVFLVVMMGAFFAFLLGIAAVAAWQAPGVAAIVVGVILFLVGITFLSYYVEHRRKRNDETPS